LKTSRSGQVALWLTLGAQPHPIPPPIVPLPWFGWVARIHRQKNPARASFEHVQTLVV
jgi:hypothetical protein